MRRFVPLGVIAALAVTLTFAIWLFNNRAQASAVPGARGTAVADGGAGNAVPGPLIVSPTAVVVDNPAAYPTSAVGILLTPEPGARAPAPSAPAVLPTTGPTPGQPALRPSNTNAAAGIPALTEQDVREQVLSLPHWQGTFPTSGPVTVSNVEFATGKQVNARLNRPGSQPDNRLICFVTLMGNFNRTAHAQGLPGPTATPVASGSIYLIFDAMTGNLLAMGEGAK